MRIPDSIDEELARLLGQDARQNSETLAKRLRLSAATVRRRLRNLLKSGSLRIVGVVEPGMFGFPVVAVFTFNVAPDKLEIAMEALIKRPEISWLSAATGRCDIIALARFPSTDVLSNFLAKELRHIKGVRDSETLVCFDVKKGRYIQFTLR